jgi:hypothetical protein
LNVIFCALSFDTFLMSNSTYFYFLNAVLNVVRLINKKIFKELCRLTIENPPPRVSSMSHFLLERGPNP